MHTLTSTLSEQLDRFDHAFSTAADRHPPYGFVHLDDFTGSESVAGTRMSTSHYVCVLSSCGMTDRPEVMQYPDGFNTVGELEQRLGGTNIGGLGGFLLGKAAQNHVMQMVGVDTLENLKHRVRGQEKVMDAGLASGVEIMGMIAQRGIEAMRRADTVPTAPDMVEALWRSTDTLPMAFANMSNRKNRKTEVLYGVRLMGSYDQESARYELGLDDEDEFSFEYAGGKLHALNFDKVQSIEDVSGRCAALNHPVFTTAWRQICQNTVTIMTEQDKGKLQDTPDTGILKIYE